MSKTEAKLNIELERLRLNSIITPQAVIDWAGRCQQKADKYDEIFESRSDSSPLGVCPRYIHNAKRARALSHAIIRQIERADGIDPDFALIHEWSAELADLTK